MNQEPLEIPSQDEIAKAAAIIKAAHMAKRRAEVRTFYGSRIVDPRIVDTSFLRHVMKKKLSRDG